MPKLVSVVIPVYREAGNLEPLVERLEAVAARAEDVELEYLFVNDGSPDDSLLVLARLASRSPRVKVIDLSRNFGKELALTCGLHYAKGDAVVCLDADLQHPPELILDMIAAWRRGAEVVIGVRRTHGRQPVLRRLGSRFFYWVMRRISETDVVTHATDFRLMDRKVVDAVQLIGERERIFRGLVDWLGFRREQLEFDAAPRTSGAASYSFGKLWSLALHSFVSHSSAPLRFVAYIGAFITFASTLLLVWMFSAEHLISYHWWYTPLAKVVVFNTLLIGIVLAALGAMSLYIGKIHAEILGRPLYVVRQVMNLPPDTPR